MARNNFRVDLKIKEREGNHFVTIDSLQKISPEEAVLILEDKYVVKSPKLSKLARSLDDAALTVAKDLKRITGLNFEKKK